MAKRKFLSLENIRGRALPAMDCVGRTRRLKIKRQLIILLPRNTFASNACIAQRCAEEELWNLVASFVDWDYTRLK